MFSATRRLSTAGLRTFNRSASGQSQFGHHLFKGAVAAPYLEWRGLPRDTLDSVAWTRNEDMTDKVAGAVLDWARDNGASVYCHWFQPLGAAGVRHGQSAQVQNRMFEFDRHGNQLWDFKGKNLLQGETDGSSYQNGGLRGTHTAGGYLGLDPTSPIFLRDDTVFIPSFFVSYEGYALDEKTPLLRSVDAISKEGKRLLGKMGYDVKGLTCNIGLEQEFFFVPRDAYNSRMDLQLTGRTVMGRDAPRGQEMCDHYMAPPSVGGAPYACMKEIQEQCYKMGIPLKTRHREVAPGQYEFAPLFGFCTTQIDQNLMVMQIMEEVAPKHGLSCLVHEKPFNNVNGSGKHNNWSIATSDGTNLFNFKQLAKASGNKDIFPVVMASVLKAVDEYGDLMRMSIATPGNDFRLGACEAPPSIMSVYLGTSMTNYMTAFMNGDREAYNPASKPLNMGEILPAILIPNEDRNRTSPFPYGGSRFEFRAVGSAQNTSLVNTVLNTMIANSFKEFADAIEAGASATEVAADAVKKHWKVVFNGNGYDMAEQEALTKKGLWRIDSSVDAINRYVEPKNTALFSRMGVMQPEECSARRSAMLKHYTGTVEMEVKCMIDMINQHVLPSMRDAGVGYVKELETAVKTLQSSWDDIHHTECEVEKATKARVLRLETMIDVRKICDEAEGVCPADLWTLATYKDLLFIDQTHA
jgi:glutamine synthetase